MRTLSPEAAADRVVLDSIDGESLRAVLARFVRAGTFVVQGPRV
jgi:hypothetical protein